MNKEELHRRAVKAATQSILRRGYEVIDADWESVCGNRVDLVAEDNGELVFIEVTESEDLESGFLDGDLKVRFDTISLIVLNEQRAFMRHHTNVFSQA